MHAIDPETGGFGAKLQELLYVKEDELESADKTRVALVSPSGSHCARLSLTDTPATFTAIR